MINKSTYFFYEYKKLNLLNKKKKIFFEDNAFSLNESEMISELNEQLNKNIELKMPYPCDSFKSSLEHNNGVRFDRNVIFYDLTLFLKNSKYFTLKQKIDFMANDFFEKIKESLQKINKGSNINIKISGFCRLGNIAIKVVEKLLDDEECKEKINDISLFTFGTMFSGYDLDSMKDILKKNKNSKIFSYAIPFDLIGFVNPFSISIKNFKDFLCNILNYQMYDLPFAFKHNDKEIESFKQNGRINYFLLDIKFNHACLYFLQNTFDFKENLFGTNIVKKKCKDHADEKKFHPECPNCEKANVYKIDDF